MFTKGIWNQPANHGHVTYDVNWEMGTLNFIKLALGIYLIGYVAPFLK